MKKRCRDEGCTNQAYKGGVCVTHGAKVKRCTFEGGCTNQAKKGGVCITHGSKDLNKSPKVQPNANVTPSIPSCQSINYKDEDEEELNSWIWRSYRKTK
jgi:hypothetical protein